MGTIDARGLECPKPVMKTKILADQGDAEINVRVDNEIAVSNVTRFLEGQGYTAARTGTVPDVTVSGLRRSASATGAAKTAAQPSGDWALLLLSNKIGAPSNGLGDVLMKAFLGTVLQNESPPAAIALMNEGVQMALSDRSTHDTLKELEEKGIPLLICGTCTKHFGITDKISIGTISNMFEITEAIFKTSKPLVIG